MAYKVYGSKKPLWKLMDLTETSSQVNGPLVHLTLLLIINPTSLDTHSHYQHFIYPRALVETITRMTTSHTTLLIIYVYHVD